MRRRHWFWLTLMLLCLLPALGCKVRPNTGGGLSDGPPRVDESTAVLPVFDPAAQTGPGSGNYDPSKAQSGPPAPPEPPPLPPPAIVDYGPMEEASAYQDIQIRFNRPMVPLGEKQRMKATEAGFTITPPIPGQAYWAEPTRLVFEPEGELPAAREYEVHFAAKLQAVDGPTIDVALDWAFGTERPNIDMWNSYEGAMDSGKQHWHASVLAVATQQISLATLRKHTRAETIDPQGQTHEAEIRIRELPKDRQGWREADFEISPVGHWPAGHEVVIRVDAGLTGRYGKRPMGSEAAFSFEVAEGVEVSSVECYFGRYADGCERGPLRVTFNSPIKRSQAKYVHISPVERGTKTLAIDRDQDWNSEKPKPLDRYWSVLVWGDFALDKPYEITIDPALKDHRGQGFVGQDNFEEQFVEPEPILSLHPSEGTMRLGKPAVVGVDSRHLEALDLQVAVLDDVAAVAMFSRDVTTYWPPESMAKTVSSRVPLVHTGNFGWSSHEIDLGQFTKGKPGTVLVSVGSGGLLKRAAGRRTPAPQRGLIQITNLGVTAVGTLPRGAVRVARLDDDRPVAGARIELIDPYTAVESAKVLGETDKDGLFELPAATEIPSNALLRSAAGYDRVLISIAALSRSDNLP
ncbi:MAG: alpha-2-macroglobulin, partial [Myxococcales bacterium]|nr:alpha-2-macroglobulin [Myxococcales bacterium]